MGPKAARPASVAVLLAVLLGLASVKAAAQTKPPAPGQGLALTIRFPEGLKVTPVQVTHTVLTHGLVVEDESSALLFTSDTGPTERIWQVARECDKLRAIFIDLSFPNRLTELARVSQHHSPATLLEEMSKMRPDTPIYAVHVKAAYRDRIVEEIESLNNPRVKVAEVGREYEF